MNLNGVAIVVAERAESMPNVKAAYLFGSRVKGTNRSDSDLDVAIALDGEDEGLADWICDAAEMRNALGAMLPMPLDLHVMHSEDAVVMPAVKQHGRLVFKR